MQSTIVTATSGAMREINRSIILNLIRAREPISRIELSGLTGISPSNVSAIVDALLGENFLVEQTAVPKGRGRVPTHVYLNPDRCRVLAVNIRPDHTSMHWAGLPGRALGAVSFATPSRPEALVQELKRAFDAERTRICAPGGTPLHRIGVSVPGIVKAEDGTVVIAPSLPRYAGFRVAHAIAQALEIPVLADNDCNAGVLAETWWNEDGITGAGDIMMLSIAHLGVGSGLVLNGELYRGHNRAWAGEFGHMVIDPSGPKCPCGRRGCWETLVSNQATWRRYAPRRPFTPARFSELVELALAGDRKARAAFEQTAGYLSLGLSNIAFAVNPSAVVIAGELTRVWRLIRRIAQNRWTIPRVRPRIRISKLPLNELYVRGAIVLALSDVFTEPKFGRQSAGARAPYSPARSG